MAERRMFSKTIIDSDAFLDMPLTTQALYFHLAARANDDGTVNNIKAVMRAVHATENDRAILIMHHFIAKTKNDGVVKIKAVCEEGESDG